MTGDAFKKVLPGDTLDIGAATWNAVMESVRAQRGRLHDVVQDSEREIRSSTLALIKNATGSNLERFSVVALRGPIIDPSIAIPGQVDEFASRLNLIGGLPAEPTKCCRFAVMFQPVELNGIGRGVVAGVTPVRINVIRETDTFAEVDPGNTSSLRSVPYGTARILWKEEGLGLKWAIVRLSDRPRFAVFELPSNAWGIGYPEPPLSSDGNVICRERLEPDGWAKMPGCRPVFYFKEGYTYDADSQEPTETVWHAVGCPGTERKEVVQLHKAEGLWPSKYGCRDWVWCHWNDHECRWQILGTYEDHWRFKLLGPLEPCREAAAQLVLYDPLKEKWRTVGLTFMVCSPKEFP